MKTAIISDTHFGDPMCALVEKKDDSTYSIGPKYDEFKEVVGEGLDYLVMLGDIFDFSIVEYKEAYQAGKIFFNQLVQDNITKKIIYVPGNHDFDFWNTVEYEVNIVNRVRNGKSPRDFKWSMPGIIDTRTNAKKEFFLPGVTEQTGGNIYGGLFLDNIADGLSFYVAYPNLYMMTDNESILLTHGQYMEMFWSLLSEWIKKIAQQDLEIGDALDIKEMVSINFPLSQLSCSGVGQAGPLTNIVRKVQREVKDNNLIRVKKYLNRLDNEIDKLTDYPWYSSYKEWGTDLISNKIKEIIIESLQESKSTRYDREFVNSREVQERFKNFYEACLVEIDDLNNNYSLDIANPGRVIFGHTHEPIAWNSNKHPKTKIGTKIVRLFNTGGWLYKSENDKKKFVGAEIFLYDNQNGMSSKNI